MDQPDKSPETMATQTTDPRVPTPEYLSPEGRNLLQRMFEEYDKAQPRGPYSPSDQLWPTELAPTEEEGRQGVHFCRPE